MKRRAFLAAGTALGALGLAGCTGADGAGPGGAPTDGTTDGPVTDPKTDRPTTTDDASDGWRFDPASDDPHASAAVGDAESVLLSDANRPHDVSVWNDSQDARDVRVAVTAGDEARREAAWTVPARAYVSLRLVEPAAYTLTVFLDGERAGEVPVESGHFDCNDSDTKVQATAGGDLRFRTVSTLVACPEPRVATSSFAAEDGTCGSRDDASVSVDGRTVTVAGRLAAPDPCHGAELAGGRWDEARETLTLTVAATEPDADECVQCVGEVPYEATVTFADVPPACVVEHAHWGETVEVTATD